MKERKKTSIRESKQVLLRDQSRALKLKTGLKAGKVNKASPIL
jgi:hypothetical protein